MIRSQVHNDHDPIGRGNGEFELAVYVQGSKISLTDASADCLYTGTYPPCGLGGVAEGETVDFDNPTDPNARADIIVDLDGKKRLTIFTVGHEADACDRIQFPDHVDGLDNPDPQVGWYATMVDIQQKLNSAPKCIANFPNSDETLGTVTLSYGRTEEYGKGSHEVKSSIGDFTLRFTISIISGPAPEERELKVVRYESSKRSNWCRSWFRDICYLQCTTSKPRARILSLWGMAMFKMH